MRRHSKVWIVLADGAGARILQHRTREPGKFDELARAVSEEARQPAHERVSDGPDRGFEKEPASLRHVADIVSRAAAQGLFDALVLVAPAHTLGTLRRALNAAAGERLIREETKDLLRLPEHALPARLVALLRR